MVPVQYREIYMLCLGRLTTTRYVLEPFDLCCMRIVLVRLIYPSTLDRPTVLLNKSKWPKQEKCSCCGAVARYHEEYWSTGSYSTTVTWNLRGHRKNNLIPFALSFDVTCCDMHHKTPNIRHETQYPHKPSIRRPINRDGQFVTTMRTQYVFRPESVFAVVLLSLCNVQAFTVTPSVWSSSNRATTLQLIDPISRPTCQRITTGIHTLSSTAGNFEWGADDDDDAAANEIDFMDQGVDNPYKKPDLMDDDGTLKIDPARLLSPRMNGSNLYLVGMMGSGKSAVGKIVAKRM